MVHFAPIHQSCVVIGSGGIDYGGVHFVVGCKFEPLGNNCFYVVAAVRLVEMVVAGNYLFSMYSINPLFMQRRYLFFDEIVINV